MFRTGILKRSHWFARCLPLYFYSRTEFFMTLAMSASKRTIDSYFSPKSNNENSKKRVRETSSVNENLPAKRLPKPILSSTSSTEDEIGCSQTNASVDKSKPQLSPEQKQMIEEKRLMAVEKLQGKSDVALMGESWRDALRPEFKKDYFLKLRKFVQSERAAKTIYPPEKHVFSWTNMCTVKEVKVVIIGQDPYHGPNQAHGLCFSVPIGVKAPPSLQNIYKEMKDDIEGFEIPDHGYLIGWASQGVLLLNAVLTVVAHNANSHQGKGWENFTDAVIKWINQNSEHVVFLLWGSYAQKKGASIDKKRHCVLKGPHPSPLSAHRGFFGCKHFSKTNAYLTSHGRKPIDWNHLPKSL